MCAGINLKYLRANGNSETAECRNSQSLLAESAARIRVVATARRRVPAGHATGHRQRRRVLDGTVRQGFRRYLRARTRSARHAYGAEAAWNSRLLRTRPRRKSLF